MVEFCEYCNIWIANENYQSVPSCSSYMKICRVCITQKCYSETCKYTKSKDSNHCYLCEYKIYRLSKCANEVCENNNTYHNIYCDFCLLFTCNKAGCRNIQVDRSNFCLEHFIDHNAEILEMLSL
jgi:hypothetical protein